MADILTKPLGATKVKKICTMMGLTSTEDGDR